MSKETNLSHELLTWMLEYNKDTGIFIWKNKSSKYSHVKIGSVAGGICGSYIIIRILGYNYLAHRLAWFYVHGVWPKNFIDHIDCNKINNAIVNLREATMVENKQNQNSSGKANILGKTIPGVSFDRTRNKYAVYLKVGGKTKNFGRYNTLIEAEQECIKQRRIHYQFNTI
jgi:hypothetical protein